MAEMAGPSRVVVDGIDTHKDLHVAAVLDLAGVVLGTESFATTRAGYAPWCDGCEAMARCGGSASRGPAATAPA